MAPVALPSDILILILQSLPLSSIAAFALTCKYANKLVNDYGWSEFLRDNGRPSYSLQPTSSKWDARTRIRYDALSDRSWASNKFIARPLSRPWQGKQQPRMAICKSRLLIAGGKAIYDYIFTEARTGNHADAPEVQFNGMHDLVDASHGRLYITSITFVPDEGKDQTICVGFSDGMLEQITLPPVSRGDRAGDCTDTDTNDRLTLDRRIQVHEGDVMEDLACAGNTLLSLSSSGLAGLWDMSHTTPSPALIDLETRSWVAHLALRSSTPYAAFGISSNRPLAVHPITEAALSPEPIAILHTQQCDAGGRLRPSAVYGITGSPDASPWGGSEQVLISGWYDSKVRVHDMRSSSRLSGKDNTTSGKPAPLKPVMSFRDPWSYEPIYTVACGGGSASHIAAGSARHSVVAFWDVRSPKEGWSVHAPGNDSSPVYAMALEGSRLFGATQSRPFVYDFGPGVTSTTYPPIDFNRRDDLVKTKDGSPGCYVTKYFHHHSQGATM